MALLAKLGFGVFLCLSFFMIACSVTRAAGNLSNDGAIDNTWKTFWFHVEGCIGVLMASVTVYRSIFVGSTKAIGSFQRFLDRVVQMRTSEHFEDAAVKPGTTRTGKFGKLLLSKIPTATLTGLASFIATATQSPNDNTNLATANSANDMADDSNYHAHLRRLRVTDVSSCEPTETEAWCYSEGTYFFYCLSPTVYMSQTLLSIAHPRLLGQAD